MIHNPRLSIHDFTDATDSNNHSLSIGSHVSGSPGVGNSNDVDDQLEELVGRTIRVPVYHSSSGSGQNTNYTVSHFALVTINEVCLPRNSCPGVSGNDKRINATFVGYDDEACDGSSGGSGGGGNNPPVAVDDTATTDKDTPVVINLLGNDSDPDGDTITVDSMTDPAKGTVVDNGDGRSFDGSGTRLPHYRFQPGYEPLLSRAVVAGRRVADPLQLCPRERRGPGLSRPDG